MVRSEAGDPSSTPSNSPHSGVYQVVTGTEGPVDEEELWAFLLHEFSEAKLLSKVGELNRLVFSSAVGEFSDVMERFAADSRAPLEGLAEAARLMEAESPAAAPEFKDALLMLARNVATRSKRYRVVDFETFRSATEAQRDAMTRPISAAAREHGVSAVAEALGLKV